MLKRDILEIREIATAKTKPLKITKVKYVCSNKLWDSRYPGEREVHLYEVFLTAGKSIFVEANDELEAYVLATKQLQVLHEY